MSEETKLILALMQVENLVSLTSENEWKSYLYGHLSSIKYELERQLTNLNHSSKITAVQSQE